MQTTAFPLWLIPFGFVAFWFLVIFLISRISGWATLADSFRLESDFIGQKWNWQRGVMRWGCKFNNVLTLGCDQRGLYMATMLFFRFGHPPLLIPWDQISVSKRRYFLFEYVQLKLGREEQIPLLLPPYAADRLRAAAGAQWPGSVK